MLTSEQIETNKTTFKKLIETLKTMRPADDWDGLMLFLDNSDFFEAPASTIFHAAYTGGLVEHTLNVYEALMNLTKMTYPDYETTDENGNVSITSDCPFGWDSLAIAALFHDLSKTNFYSWEEKNVKIYLPSDYIIPDNKHLPTGERITQDAKGYYYWTSEHVWKKREICDYFKYGSHEEDSVFMLENYVNLLYPEKVAILHHTSAVGTDFQTSAECSYAFSSNKLAALLHIADTYATFVVEETAQIK